MTDGPFARVKYLAFDIFGTVMDLSGSLTGPAGDFLAAHGSDMPGEAFYAEWRERQRIEQYQDNLLMLGHSGYLETCRRAFVYCLKKHNVVYTDEGGPGVHEGLRWAAAVRRRHPRVAEAGGALQAGRTLERGAVVPGGAAGQQRAGGVRRNNLRGPGWRVQALTRGSTARRCSGWDASHPEIMMVAAHSFDILGAQACGFRAAYVNRYGLPTEESEYQPEIIVEDFVELASKLLG